MLGVQRIMNEVGRRSLPAIYTTLAYSGIGPTISPRSVIGREVAACRTPDPARSYI